MSQWPSTKARRVLAALLRIGWSIKRHSGGAGIFMLGLAIQRTGA
jgi:predicted RNA binding protein YcfA (HicA-like mRNA interferase family)